MDFGLAFLLFVNGFDINICTNALIVCFDAYKWKRFTFNEKINWEWHVKVTVIPIEAENEDENINIKTKILKSS